MKQEDSKLTPMVMASLQNKGFFLTRQGLFSDQGDVSIGTDEGVVYTLRYGGPVFAEGDELVVGAPDDAEQKKDAAPRRTKRKTRQEAGGAQENRFLMVTVSFDPTLVEKPESIEPKPFVKPTGPVTLPDNVFAPDPKDPKVIADQKAAEDKKTREKADYEKKLADGKKKVDGFVARFGPVVLRDAGRELPLDQPGPRCSGRAQEAPGRGRSRAGPGGFPGRAAQGISAVAAATVAEVSVLVGEPVGKFRG